MFKRRSFFEKLTGSMPLEEEEKQISETRILETEETPEGWQEEEEGELSVDVYQTPTDVIVQAMVAGVRPEDLEIETMRDTISIKGRRDRKQAIDEENYLIGELYWGAFSRTISLPVEVEPDEAEATEQNGLLTIKLPKIDKGKKKAVKIKSI